MLCWGDICTKQGSFHAVQDIEILRRNNNFDPSRTRLADNDLLFSTIILHTWEFVIGCRNSGNRKPATVALRTIALWSDVWLWDLEVNVLAVSDVSFLLDSFPVATYWHTSGSDWLVVWRVGRSAVFKLNHNTNQVSWTKTFFLIEQRFGYYCLLVYTLSPRVHIIIRAAWLHSRGWPQGRWLSPLIQPRSVGWSSARL